MAAIEMILLSDLLHLYTLNGSFKDLNDSVLGKFLISSTHLILRKRENHEFF